MLVLMIILTYIHPLSVVLSPDPCSIEKGGIATIFRRFVILPARIQTVRSWHREKYPPLSMLESAENLFLILVDCPYHMNLTVHVYICPCACAYM